MQSDKIIKETQDKCVPNYDYLFENKIFTRGFLEQLIKTCVEIKKETENKFDFIFEKENKYKTNTYMIMDYNILSISFISYLISESEKNTFYKKIVELFIGNKNYYEKNLLISLAKKNITYFNFNKRFYKDYSLYRYTQDELFILNFRGIAMKIDEVTLLLNNENLINSFKKLIKKNYRNFFYNKNNKNNKKKKRIYFHIDESKFYKNIFKESRNDI